MHKNQFLMDSQFKQESQNFKTVIKIGGRIYQLAEEKDCLRHKLCNHFLKFVQFYEVKLEFLPIKKYHKVNEKTSSKLEEDICNTYKQQRMHIQNI